MSGSVRHGSSSARTTRSPPTSPETKRRSGRTPPSSSTSSRCSRGSARRACCSRRTQQPRRSARSNEVPLDRWPGRLPSAARAEVARLAADLAELRRLRPPLAPGDLARRRRGVRLLGLLPRPARIRGAGHRRRRPAREARGVPPLPRGAHHGPARRRVLPDVSASEPGARDDGRKSGLRLRTAASEPPRARGPVGRHGAGRGLARFSVSRRNPLRSIRPWSAHEARFSTWR